MLGGWEHLRLEERSRIIDDLAEALHVYGLLHHLDTQDDGTKLWLLPAGALRWELGSGESYYDPIRMPSHPDQPGGGTEPNPYFRDLYTDRSMSTHRIQAREHTAQVSHEQRTERERSFRDGDLPVLFCSPTMELGVDIAELNAVNMRNVPPTPANYAQRSGRAGRSGQPALVTTFCATGNSHDQHFLRHQEQMIAGQVKAPRLDLANEDLIRAHIHSVWLAHSGLNLGGKLGELLDLSGSEPSLELQAHVTDVLADDGIRDQARNRAQALLDDLGAELSEADWFSDDWLGDTMGSIPRRFAAALDRWKSLYRSALRQSVEQNRIRLSPGRSRQDRQQADRLRNEANRQLDLLRGDMSTGFQSDFYPYRYFAAEGFLPGYSFPRLPLSAFVPGCHRFGTEFLQRPRFLAISEFSPHSLIYHEGNRYQVNRVILDSDDFGDDQDSSSIITRSIKRCETCGYLHEISIPPGPDVCERCSAQLPPATRNMFRLRNVSTRRRDRITSNEEQRQRMGYDIVAAVRFAHRRGDHRPGRERLLHATGTAGDAHRQRDGGPMSEHTPHATGTTGDAHRHRDGGPMLRLSYGDTATIWRINEGPRRRANRTRLGFVLDMERGYWARDTDAAEGEGDDAQQDPLSKRTVRVVPYVTDTRNALLIEPVSPASGRGDLDSSAPAPAPAEREPVALAGSRDDPNPPAPALAEREPVALAGSNNDPDSPAPAELDVETMASIQAALSTALQVVFHLESNEIAAEPLPSRDDRRLLLVYEAAEGGAGALKQLVDDDPVLWRRVAWEALRRCHADPETGEDRDGPGGVEACEAACYDCLMSYSNQGDHGLLDRRLAIEYLLPLAQGAAFARDEHDEELEDSAESALERRFLQFLERGGFRRPERSQVYFEAARTRPDFVYDEACAVVYVDGPHHDYPQRSARDATQELEHEQPRLPGDPFQPHRRLAADSSAASRSVRPQQAHGCGERPVTLPHTSGSPVVHPGLGTRARGAPGDTPRGVWCRSGGSLVSVESGGLLSGLWVGLNGGGVVVGDGAGFGVEFDAGQDDGRAVDEIFLGVAAVLHLLQGSAWCGVCGGFEFEQPDVLRGVHGHVDTAAVGEVLHPGIETAGCEIGIEHAGIVGFVLGGCAAGVPLVRDTGEEPVEQLPQALGVALS